MCFLREQEEIVGNKVELAIQKAETGGNIKEEKQTKDGKTHTKRNYQLRKVI